VVRSSFAFALAMTYGILRTCRTVEESRHRCRQDRSVESMKWLSQDCLAITDAQKRKRSVTPTLRWQCGIPVSRLTATSDWVRDIHLWLCTCIFQDFGYIRGVSIECWGSTSVT